MSKPYLLRGKHSPEWTAYDFVSDYRNKSPHRGYTTGRTSPYKSEFDLDGSLYRRSTFYSPPRLSPRSSRAYLAAKAASLGLPRSGIVSDWSRESKSPSSMSRAHAVSPEIHPPRSSRGSDVENAQASGRGSRGGTGSGSGSGASPSHEESPHKDLKRKMVFDLHKEINKTVHTTHLEEISDMDRITDICFTNLRVMMENKKHRRFLHHMNNNALGRGYLFLEAASLDCLDFTNNALHPVQKASKSLKSLQGVNEDIISLFERRKASMKPSEMLQAVSPIDPFKMRGPKLNFTGPGRLQDIKEKKKALGETSGAGPIKPITSAAKEPEDATVLFLAELEDQIDHSKKEVQRGAATKVVPLLTPEEVLACHYLRLNRDQVARLEKAIRDKGADPGIHVHMDVSTYDIFSEIRRIRKTQAAGTGNLHLADETDEEELLDPDGAHVAPHQMASHPPQPHQPPPPGILSGPGHQNSKKNKEH